MPSLQGQVISISVAGDAVTDIAIGMLTDTPRDDQVRVACEGHVTSGIFPTEHGQPQMTFVAVEGASGFVELALVGDDASRFLGIKPGAAVSIDW